MIKCLIRMAKDISYLVTNLWNNLYIYIYIFMYRDISEKLLGR